MCDCVCVLCEFVCVLCVLCVLCVYVCMYLCVCARFRVMYLHNVDLSDLFVKISTFLHILN